MAQTDPAFAGFIKSGDAVENGRLAGAIRADEGGDVALARLEAKIIDCDKPAKTHGQVFDAKQRILRALHQPWPWPTRSAPDRFLSRRKTDGARVEISPRGRQIMISTMANPKISIRYCVGSNVGPNTSLRKPRSRVISVPPIITTAATATPI